VQLVAAMTLVAELQDFLRFDNPRQLMAYVGLVPGEHSSGPKRRQGSITKAGNSAARRMLVEVAWHYQHSPRVSPIIAKRHDELPKAVTDIAWKAQLRLNAKFKRLVARRVMKNKAVVAVARERSHRRKADPQVEQPDSRRARSAVADPSATFVAPNSTPYSGHSTLEFSRRRRRSAGTRSAGRVRAC